ncbi:MAG: peptidoglycan-binding protein, partial [Clostridia bacterium]|nr:peptidoglycan-binding protein [Clostridia bacterium]
RLTVGDEGDDVYAVEEYLDAMGYGTGKVDGVFDVFTEQAVWSFQRENALFPYGVADFNTQLKMHEVLEGFEILEDRQFERAVEILSEK